jgi:isatin hydrolase
MDQSLQHLIDDFRNGFLTRRGFLTKAGALGLSATALAALAREAQAQATPETGATPATGMAANSPAEVIWSAIAGGEWELVDLSLAAAPNYPVAWPDQPQLTVTPIMWYEEITGPYGTVIARQGPVDVTVYQITEHCATQIDFAPHFIPPPGVSVEGSEGSEMGLKTGDTYELSTLMGPAVVVDARDLLAKNTENGMSAHITRAWLEQWEAQHGQFQPGDVPIWYSEYDDMYYQPFPNGDRFQDRMLWAPLITKTAPGWVAADPDAMELLQERGVVHVATDGPSFGWTEGGQPTHVAGLKYGMSWTEGAVNVGSLPLRGAFFVSAPYKVANQAAGLTRAFAIKPAGTAGVAESPPLVLE